MSILDKINEQIVKTWDGREVEQIDKTILKNVLNILKNNFKGWQYREKKYPYGEAYYNITTNYDENLNDLEKIEAKKAAIPFADKVIENIQTGIQTTIQDLEKLGFVIKITATGAELTEVPDKSKDTKYYSDTNTYGVIRQIPDKINNELGIIQKFRDAIGVLNGDPEALAKKEKYEKDAESMAKFYHGKKYAD